MQSRPVVSGAVPATAPKHQQLHQQAPSPSKRRSNTSTRTNTHVTSRRPKQNADPPPPPPHTHKETLIKSHTISKSPYSCLQLGSCLVKKNLDLVTGHPFCQSQVKSSQRPSPSVCSQVKSKNTTLHFTTRYTSMHYIATTYGYGYRDITSHTTQD